MVVCCALRSGSTHCDLALAVEVRQPTAQLRSGIHAHCDLTLAVEARSQGDEKRKGEEGRGEER